MTWVLWSLVANACIMFVEYTNRHTGTGTWLSVLPYTIGPIIVAQFGLYKAFSGAPHLMVAWLAFTLGNSVMRVSMVGFTGSTTGEHYHWAIMPGIALMMAGAFIVKESLRYGAAS